MLIPVAKRSKAPVCGRSLAGISGSDPNGGKDASFDCCVVRQRSLRRVDSSSRGVLLIVGCLTEYDYVNCNLRRLTRSVQLWGKKFGTLSMLQVHSVCFRYSEYASVTLSMLQVQWAWFRYSEYISGTVNVIQVHLVCFRYTRCASGTVSMLQLHWVYFRYSECDLGKVSMIQAGWPRSRSTISGRTERFFSKASRPSLSTVRLFIAFSL